jgi:hypothetical protein
VKVIVTNSKHDQYNRVGELVKKGWAGLWVVRIPDPDGDIEVHLGAGLPRDKAAARSTRNP